MSDVNSIARPFVVTMGVGLRKGLPKRKNAPEAVAQLVEQRTFNP